MNVDKEDAALREEYEKIRTNLLEQRNKLEKRPKTLRKLTATMRSSTSPTVRRLTSMASTGSSNSLLKDSDSDPDERGLITVEEDEGEVLGKKKYIRV